VKNTNEINTRSIDGRWYIYDWTGDAMKGHTWVRATHSRRHNLLKTGEWKTSIYKRRSSISILGPE